MKKLYKTLAVSLLMAVTLSFAVSCKPSADPVETPADTPKEPFKIEKDNGFDYTIEGNVITLSADGTEDNVPEYTLSGDFEGKIIVKSKGTVLNLNGVTLTNAGEPVIEAELKVVIEAKAGTTNTISTTGDYDENSKSGAINGKKKVEIGGSGTLIVSGTVCHGIKGKEVEVKGSGNFTVSGNKKGSAINCNEFTVKTEKTFTLNIQNSKNGIKADGNITIASGTFNLKNLTTGFKTDKAKAEETPHSISVTGATVNFESDVTKHYDSDNVPAES